MDGSRFDTWTRRRFGMAAGGFVATVGALAGLDDAAAKKNKKKCKKLGDSCNPGGKRKCCHNRKCSHPLVNGEGNHCCKAAHEACTDTKPEECCSGQCNEPTGCFCKGTGQECTANPQCCSNKCQPVNAHSECVA